MLIKIEHSDECNMLVICIVNQMITLTRSTATEIEDVSKWRPDWHDYYRIKSFNDYIERK